MENNQNQGQQNWQANAPYGQPPYTQGYQNQPYGQQPYYQGGYGPNQPEQPGKGLGIAAMVCGILSLLLIILVVVLVGAAFGAYGFEYFDYFLSAAEMAALGAGLIL